MGTVTNQNLIQLWKKTKLYIADKLDDYVQKEQLAEKVYVHLKDSAFPNPEALIFTGAVEAEYNGSKAMSVEIPAGEEWEVLLDVTMEESVNRITITEFPDGGDIKKLRKLFISGVTVRDADGNGTGGVHLRHIGGTGDDSGGSALCGGMNTAGSIEFKAFLERVGDELHFQNIMSSHSNTYNPLVYKTSYNDVRGNSIPFGDWVTGIQFKAWTASLIFGPGSTLKVWAVRDK